MSELDIDFPSDLNYALSLINRLFQDNISLVDTDGTIYCSPENRDIWPHDTHPNTTGRVRVFEGDHAVDISFANLEDARHFLMGIHYAFFLSTPISEIEKFLSSRSHSHFEEIGSQWIKRFR